MNWVGSPAPTVNGVPIKLKTFEHSRSLAIHPDGRRFVLGTDWYLRAFDPKGNELWSHSAPGDAWAVNISGDGRLVVAAYADGTIRWHRMDDGRELLALQVLRDKANWVAWTPEGFYDATPGAFGVLKWHVNRGREVAADALRSPAFLDSNDRMHFPLCFKSWRRRGPWGLLTSPRHASMLRPLLALPSRPVRDYTSIYRHKRLW